MVRAPRPPTRPLLALTTAVLALATAPGCGLFGSRQRLDDSRRMIQTLRAENAQIKSQMLSYRNLNRDYSERAVDDARRLAQQDEAIERLERGVQAYQRERDELRAAFGELRDNLPAAAGSGARAATQSPPARPERPVPTEHEAKTGHSGGWSPASPSAGP